MDTHTQTHIQTFAQEQFQEARRSPAAGRRTPGLKKDNIKLTSSQTKYINHLVKSLSLTIKLSSLSVGIASYEIFHNLDIGIAKLSHQNRLDCSIFLHENPVVMSVQITVICVQLLVSLEKYRWRLCYTLVI